MNRFASLLMLGAFSVMTTTGCTAILAGSAIGAGAVVAADGRTVGTMVDDEGIELKASKYLSNNREIYEASKLDATSVNGNVLLTGQCRDKEYIEYIVTRVKAIPEVKNVINRIEMIEPLGMSERSTDTWITTKVKTQLLFGQQINSGRFKVITENRVVYLIGVVNHSEANRAVNVARGIDGVKKVVKIFEYMEDKGTANVVNGDAATAPSSSSGASNTATPAAAESPAFYEDNSIMEQPVTMSSGTASSAPGTTGTRQAKPVYDLVEENVPLESAPAASSADSSSDLFIIE
ncbi:BON domain-containing protein [uncultured Ruminobacter sp.]|uniref:BON domain-containing protein n=1 Tax=Ruminobacter sp. TaxID=2774296 RepID=UPI0025FB069D|nr:BON domain-containing protein [uncultured Ruminobacter sp.]